MISNPEPCKMTVEQYLAWETQQEVRYEYVDGAVFAMTGGAIPDAIGMEFVNFREEILIS